jgi:hypothetical protein
MMNRRLHLVLAWGVSFLATACWQQVDSNRVGELPCDFGNVCPPPDDDSIPNQIDPHYPLRYDSDGGVAATDDDCVATQAQSMQIRTLYCAGCHSGPNPQGGPAWGFVLDDAQLVTAVWHHQPQPDQRFVIPGDPDNSAVYVRAWTGTMPPIPVSVDSPNSGLPRPTISDISVLRQWILCLGAGASGG